MTRKAATIIAAFVASIPIASNSAHPARKRATMRNRLSVRFATSVLLVAAAVFLGAPAALARADSPLHLTVTRLNFTSFSCTDPVNPFLCDVTVTAEVRSNLSSTPGTAENSLVIDFSPAFDAPCNTVDETPTFTFDAGTITTHSYHRDCNATISPGPRVNTDFVVTGGTGAFAGATGSGHELSAHADAAAIVYNGTISF